MVRTVSSSLDCVTACLMVWPTPSQRHVALITALTTPCPTRVLFSCRLGLNAVRELMKNRLVQQLGLPVPLNNLHNAAFLSMPQYNEQQGGKLLPDALVDPVRCPNINAELSEFFRGTLAYRAQDRWSLADVKDCALLGGALKLMQDLNTPAQRQQLLEASVARSNRANPGWQIGLPAGGAAG